jgi:hypothetical protein
MYGVVHLITEELRDVINIRLDTLKISPTGTLSTVSLTRLDSWMGFPAERASDE